MRDQQVSKGLATWAGVVAAAGQYVASIAVFLEADDRALALGPLATATVTLVTVIIGRMEQAKAKTEAAAFRGAVAPGELGAPADLSKEVPGGGPVPDGDAR